jgi:hypothetical protein
MSHAIAPLPPTDAADSSPSASALRLVPQPAGTSNDRGERGRKAILAGWLITMTGVVGYCTVMMRSGGDATILGGLRDGGPLGWVSAALLAVGVATWLAGNLALLRDLASLR